MTVTPGVPYALPVPSDNLGYGCPTPAKVKSAERGTSYNTACLGRAGRSCRGEGEFTKVASTHAPTVPHEPGLSTAEDHSGVLCSRESMMTKFGLNNASCKGTRAGTIMDHVIPETMSPHADPCTA